MLFLDPRTLETPRMNHAALLAYISGTSNARYSPPSPMKTVTSCSTSGVAIEVSVKKRERKPEPEVAPPRRR